MKIEVTVTIEKDSAGGPTTFAVGQSSVTCYGAQDATDVYLALMSEFHRKRTLAERHLCLQTVRGSSCSLVAGHVGQCDPHAVVTVG